MEQYLQDDIKTFFFVKQGSLIDRKEMFLGSVLMQDIHRCISNEWEHSFRLFVVVVDSCQAWELADAAI